MTQHGSGNFWTARKDARVSWQAEFAPPASAGNLETLLRLTRAILATGERESIYRVLETCAPHTFRAAPGWDYADHLQQRFAETGVLPLFVEGSGVAPTAEGRLRTPGRICYFDAGNVTEADVDDLGALLGRLHPEKARDGFLAGRFMARVAPVAVSGHPLRLGQREFFGGLRPTLLRVDLHSDIWLPWVLGGLEERPAPTVRGLWDNRRLAACHTPRFNRFLGNVREAVLAAGGAWSLLELEGSARQYAFMVTEHGIRLDA